MTKLWHKLKESIYSVLPVTVLVTVLALVLVEDFDINVLVNFLIASVAVILGMALFSLGADTAMMRMGEEMGSEITKTKNIGLIVLLSFLLGFAISVAEPDLWALGVQLNGAINTYVLVIVIAVGVGIFLVVSMLRIIFQWSLNKLLILLYSMVFVLAVILAVTGKGVFLPVAFDSGGVTTGPMTVPFIMAIGIGVAAMKGNAKEEDNFGLIALCSVGPILAVMLLGVFSDASSAVYTQGASEVASPLLFLSHLPGEIKNVSIAIAPILVIFLIFNFAKLKLPKLQLERILIGVLYVFAGLVLFLTGVTSGFLPAANMLGAGIAKLSFNWILIPIGAVVGFFIVMAEPAVHVLNEQVETLSNGKIKKSTMLITLMAGVGVSIALAMIRVLTSINILWLVVPGYAIALALTFFVPKVYTAIAFDSGGVASGPMASTFLLPFAVGGSMAVNGAESVMTDAFGVVAMVAMTPLIAVQLIGLVAVIKERKAAKALALRPALAAGEGVAGVCAEDIEIIELD